MIEYTIRLDLETDNLNTKLFLNAANRNSIVFNYELFLRGEKLNYSGFNKARLIFKRADNSVIEDTVDIKDNRISYKLIDSIFAVEGPVLGQLDLISNDEITASLHYSFGIINDLLDSPIESIGYSSVFEQLVNDMEDIITKGSEVIEGLGGVDGVTQSVHYGELPPNDKSKLWLKPTGYYNNNKENDV